MISPAYQHTQRQAHSNTDTLKVLLELWCQKEIVLKLRKIYRKRENRMKKVIQHSTSGRFVFVCGGGGLCLNLNDKNQTVLENNLTLIHKPINKQH